MKKYQVVEKDAFGTDWAPARFGDLAVMKYDTPEEANKSAKQYVTSLNVENALTADSKLEGLEAYMVDDNGVYLGFLDGKDWYMQYPKDVPSRTDKTKIAFKKGEVVKDNMYYLLEGKREVKVREVPGA